jgi:hypothetical protein
VDGIVFVADSQLAMLDANRESIQNLTENLGELGLKLADIPLVFQWNKRDLKQIVPVEVLERELNPGRLTSFQAIARTGEGVFETLRGISRLALALIKQQHLGDGPAPSVPAPAPPQLPAWSVPTPPQAPVLPPPPPPPLPPPAPRSGTDTAGGDTLPGHNLPEALSFLDLGGPMDGTPAEPLPEALSFLDLGGPMDGTPAEPLPEALSFLDLSTSSMDMFETLNEPEPAAPAPPELPRAEGQVKVMPPLVVKLLPPSASRPAATGQAGTGSGGSGGVPRVVLRAPVPASHLRGHQAAPAPSARPAPVLQVNLPPEAEGGELEVRVQVRRKGRLLAESATAIEGAGTLSIEFKRS